MVEEVAYRTVREAVSNVRRHAQARHLEIAIAVSGGMLRGSVRDDGRGFDVSRIGRRSHGVRLHLGIETLLERAELAGGRAAVESTPGKGTEVTFEVPMSGVPYRRRLGHSSPVSIRSTPRRSSPRAMMSRWISEVPSQIRSTRSSRRNRSAADVRM